MRRQRCRLPARKASTVLTGPDLDPSASGVATSECSVHALGEEPMATDRDEQQRDQQQELEEIRRSFAEMGARMGSMFEPADLDEPEQARQRALPAPPAAPVHSGLPGRPRWWWAAALVVLFVAGTAFGYILPKGDGGSDSPSPSGAATPTSQAPATPTTQPKPRTVVSVPDTCVEAAELADEVISRLTRNIRDNRLAEMLRDYTIASQACRREASP
jgi:hypothetical protein